MSERVAVVGAGAVGLATALELRRRGADVVVAERARPGAGASHGNMGLIVPSHFVPLAAPGIVLQGLRWMADPASPFYVRPRVDPALAWWSLLFARSATKARAARAAPILRELIVASCERYDELLPTLAEVGFARRGVLLLHRTEQGRAETHHEAEQARSLGLEAVELDRDGLAALEPDTRFRATGGVHYPGDAHLDPAALVAALVEACTGAGVEIVTGAPIVDVVRRGGRIVGVRTPTAEIAAGTVVIAAGAWSAQLTRLVGTRIPLQPGKGYSLTYDGAPPFSTPLLLAEARGAVTPLPGRLRLGGTMELVGFDERLNDRRLEAIHRAFADYVDLELAPIAEAERWAGLRPCSPDGLPYIGRLARDPGVILATGHAMLGITLAPITARLVAELVAGEAPSLDLEPFRPERFGR